MMKLHVALGVVISLSMLATPSVATKGRDIYTAYCIRCAQWPSKAAAQDDVATMPPVASILSSNANAIAIAVPMPKRRVKKPQHLTTPSEFENDAEGPSQQIVILSLILLGVAASTCSSSSAANNKNHQLSKEPTTVVEIDIQLVPTIDDDSVLTATPRSPQFPTGLLLEQALKLLSPTSSESSSSGSSSRDGRRDHNIFRATRNDAATADDDAPSIVEEDTLAPTTITKVTEAADDNSVGSMLGVSMLLKRIAFQKWETGRRTIFEGMSFEEDKDEKESAPAEEKKSLGYDPFGKNTDFSLPVQHQQVETFSRRTIFPELERYEYEYNF